VPAEVLLKESTAEDAQKVVELVGNLQALVMVDELLNAAEEVQREDALCSETGTSEVDASEAARGNSYTHNISDNVVEIKSTSTSTSNSSDTIDDIPLSKVYEKLHKSLASSPSTKHQKKLVDDVFEPMYPNVLERIGEMAQRRTDVCQNLLVNHPLQPTFIQPLQIILADESEQTGPASDIPESLPSQPQPTTQSSDPSVLQELANHYQGELPGFRLNLEKGSEIAFDEVVLESPQQQIPDSQMAPNTCSDLIIHPQHKPYHLNATHSNISFRIALRNLANKKSSIHKSPVSDDNHSLSEETIFVVHPINVALPSSEATFVSEPEVLIILESSAGNEQPTQIGVSLDSSAPFVLEYIHDEPYVAPNLSGAMEISSTNIPSSSNQIGPQIISTFVLPSPTLLLDSTMLKKVCENIFKDLNKSVKTRNNLVHEDNYVEEWTSLRERVDYVMFELQKSSLEAHNQAMSSLQDWIKNVISSMEEVNVKRDQEMSKLYISDTPIYIDASSIITTSVHSENLDIRWLTKLKIHVDAPILEKLKNDSCNTPFSQQCK